MDLSWRPAKVSRGALVLVAIAAVVGYLLVEHLPQRTVKRHYREKLQAAKLMDRGMRAIRKQRLAIAGKLDTEHDPNETGMIGLGASPITSKAGVLEAKQSAANPNMAAVMVALFSKAHLKKGDVVTLSLSGSFPTLNMAAVIAAEVLELEPVIISSATASSWGANDPALTWLDMERLLFEKGIIKHRSQAASLGGERDRAVGLGADGLRLARESIDRNGIEFIDPPNLKASFDQRMAIYNRVAGDRPIACYVNIGGNAGSVGNEFGKRIFAPGRVIRKTPHAKKLPDSVMTRMSRAGVPVINMLYVLQITKRFGLPFQPDHLPRPGEGGVFATLGYNLTLTWLVLIGLLAIIVLVVVWDRRRPGPDRL